MRTKFKAWAKPFIDEHVEVLCPIENLNLFSDYYLEIGSGKGQFLCSMALKHPDKMFIGVEKNVTCAGFTAKKLVENKLQNAKLIYADAEKILPLIKENSVNALFLNFSDPWPKKRQSKRRLTSEQFLIQYLRILKKGARLIFKTDNVLLFDYSLKMTQISPFKLVSSDRNYDGSNSFDEMTEYEQNFREQNLPIYRLILEKL